MRLRSEGKSAARGAFRGFAVACSGECPYGKFMGVRGVPNVSGICGVEVEDKLFSKKKRILFGS